MVYKNKNIFVKFKKEQKELAHKLIDSMGLDDLEYFNQLWKPYIDNK